MTNQEMKDEINNIKFVLETLIHWKCKGGLEIDDGNKLIQMLNSLENKDYHNSLPMIE